MQRSKGVNALWQAERAERAAAGINGSYPAREIHWDGPVKDSFERTDLTERGEGYAGAFVLGLLMAAHALLETSQDALFLRSLPSTYLPWDYLAIALLAFGVTWQGRNVSRRRERRGVLPVMILTSAFVTAGLWVLREWPSTGLLMVLYVWSGVGSRFTQSTNPLLGSLPAHVD